MMNSDEVNPFDINLQTRSHQYDNPLTSSAIESKTKISAEPLMTPSGLLQIPQPRLEAIPKVLKGPLCRNVVSNPAAHTYSIVDNLAQPPTAMSTLEVLQSCPS